VLGFPLRQGVNTSDVSVRNVAFRNLLAGHMIDTPPQAPLRHQVCRGGSRRLVCCACGSPRLKRPRSFVATCRWSGSCVNAQKGRTPGNICPRL